MAVHILPQNPLRPTSTAAYETVARQIVERIRTADEDVRWTLAEHLICAALTAHGRIRDLEAGVVTVDFDD
jgi:hypothetical protein